MSYSVQEINLEGVSPEQVQYLANLIESSKHHDANLVNKGEVPKLQQLVLNKCLSTIADDNENEMFVQSGHNNDNLSEVPNSYYMIVSASGEDNQEMFHGAEMDIERLRTNPSYTEDSCMANADTSFGEENILEHLTRQVALQQQYLCNAMNIVPTGLDSSGRCFSDHESFISQDSNYNVREPQGLNDSLNGSLINSGFAVPQPVSGFHQPVIHLHSTPENNPGRERNLVLIRNENMETPENHHHAAVTSQGRYVYTPHPKTGQLLYMTATEDGSPQLYQPLPQVTATPIPPTQKDKSIFTTPKTKNCTLNSSGEETQESPSSDDPPTDKSSATDVSTSEGSGSSSLLSSTLDKNNNKFYDISLFSSCVGEDGREQHNMKERRRRARIKDACDVLRKLVPGMSDKTDKATVFEFAARYVHFLKGFVGNQHDKDFLLKYSPY